MPIYSPIQPLRNGFSLEKRVRHDHVLRKIAEAIDFDFIYEEVKDSDGLNGNVSVPPPVILKMMLLWILYNVRSERELMLTIPERMDWMWFLGYDLDGGIPNHSVFRKARVRWGVGAFRRFFERIVGQYMQAGIFPPPIRTPPSSVIAWGHPSYGIKPIGE